MKNYYIWKRALYIALTVFATSSLMAQQLPKVEKKHGIGNLMVSILSAKNGVHIGYESVDEITFTSEGREMLHRLNGDETTLGGPVIRNGEVKAFRIKMYEY